MLKGSCDGRLITRRRELPVAALDSCIIKQTSNAGKHAGGRAVKYIVPHGNVEDSLVLRKIACGARYSVEGNNALGTALCLLKAKLATNFDVTIRSPFAEQTISIGDPWSKLVGPKRVRDRRTYHMHNRVHFGMSRAPLLQLNQLGIPPPWTYI